ncbi:hypothetical protein CVT26_010375 [Gymnopilus dilepis]|uniref:Uncharacterized protein n=1 Tax=Gymnopilus dilepis TaxID=231916 RepID=A0A409WRY0_9AGAR|nr:hypothetical protein CVT26_010375 [Gymnopilus dilepis]
MLAGAALHLLWVLFKMAKDYLFSDSSPDLEANTASSELQASDSDDSPRKLRRNFYLGLIPKAYAIITTELILSRNNVRSSTSTWTFGQTLAVLLLFSQIGDVFSLVRKFMSAAEAEKAKRKEQNEDVPKVNVEVKGYLSCDQKDAVVISVPVDETLESVDFPRPSRRS